MKHQKKQTIKTAITLLVSGVGLVAALVTGGIVAAPAWLPAVVSGAAVVERAVDSGTVDAVLDTIDPTCPRHDAPTAAPCVDCHPTPTCRTADVEPGACPACHPAR
jgi:hypothetical protein